MLHEGTKTEDAQEGSDGIKAEELALRSFMDHPDWHLLLTSNTHNESTGWYQQMRKQGFGEAKEGQCFHDSCVYTRMWRPGQPQVSALGYCSPQVLRQGLSLV